MKKTKKEEPKKTAPKVVQKKERVENEFRKSRDILTTGSYDFKKLYNAFIKHHGGVNKAKKYAKTWLERERKFPIVNTSPDLRVYKGRMEAGKIYNYKYNPKTKDDLAYYDKNPLVLALGPSRQYKGLDIGINLNFLPPKVKLNLMTIVYNNSKSKIRRSRKKYSGIIRKGKTPNPIKDEYSSKFWYTVAKRLIPKELSWAIRSYYADRRSKTVVISYNKWQEVSVLDIADMEGITLQKAYELYARVRKEQKRKEKKQRRKQR